MGQKCSTPRDKKELNASVLNSFKFYQKVSKYSKKAEYVSYNRDELSRILIIDTERIHREELSLLFKERKINQLYNKISMQKKYMKVKRKNT